MSYGFAVIDGSNFYRTSEVFNKMKTVALKKGLAAEGCIVFPFYFYICHKVPVHCWRSCSNCDL